MGAKGTTGRAKAAKAAKPAGREVEAPEARDPKDRAAKTAAYTATRKAAEAAGFEPGIAVNARGYWKALRVFCAERSIPGPWVHALKMAAPVAKAAPVETKKQKHARQERKRRARIKAAKAA
jgi:hypothetical protein